MPLGLTIPTRPKTNPVFYRDELARVLADQPERLERVLSDPASVDLLTWNVFASLDTHSDREWLAHRLEELGLAGVRAPLRISVWSGRYSGPPLRPSSAYVAAVRARSAAAGAGAGALAQFEAPIEAPARVESPDVVALIDTALGVYPRGAGGRDRVLELIDAGVEQARRLSKQLVVAAVTPQGAQSEAQVRRRIAQLSDPAALASELGRPPSAPVELREVSWPQLIAVWRSELGYLRLGGEPVRAFLDRCRALVPEPQPKPKPIASRRAG